MLVLRSTVAPGTTEFVAGYLEQQRGFASAQDVFVAHAPERIAENHFVEEIATLPHIVGGVDERSTEAVAELFEVFGVADRAHDAGAGGAGEDLDQHPTATRTSRCPTS